MNCACWDLCGGRPVMGVPTVIVKRITRSMLGFKTFRCVRILIAGIEVMHMIRKGQLDGIKDRASSAANQFYSLAFWSVSVSLPCLASSHYCDRT